VSSESKKAVRGNHEPNSNVEAHRNNLGKVTACRCQSFVESATSQQKSTVVTISAESVGNTYAPSAILLSQQAQGIVDVTPATN